MSIPPPPVIDDDDVDSFVRAVASAPARTPQPATGTVLAGGYELRERIGAGGMATVYRAIDRRLGRDVAIKLPRVDGLTDDDRAQRVRMFEREAQATARLNHPGIVTLHHVGEHAGVTFLVLELLAGETLAARLARRKTLPLSEASAILDGVLGALAYAHDRGLVHRDLTPRNVFLTTDDRVKVLDFGVAVESEAEAGTVTRGAGTPGYMAPEHDRTPDPRSDLWAAAVLFLECVSGKAPATAAPGAIPDDVPAPLRAMVSRALAADPSRRPTTASEMRAALQPALIAPRPRRSQRRRRLAIATAAGALLVAAIAVLALARPTGPRAPHLVYPNPGRWRGDPPAATPWETRLQKLDATRYAYENYNKANGSASRGELTLELLDDGTTILSGKTADVHTCATCTNVGYIEFIVLGPTAIYQYKSSYGPSHDHYIESFPPYRYAWQGPTSSIAP